MTPSREGTFKRQLGNACKILVQRNPDSFFDPPLEWCRTGVMDALETNNSKDFVGAMASNGLSAKAASALFRSHRKEAVKRDILERESKRLPLHIAVDYDETRATKEYPKTPPELRSLHPEDRVTVFHGTELDHTCAFARHGVDGRLTPPTRVFPGESWEPGIYATVNPYKAHGFGMCVVEFDAKGKDMQPPLWSNMGKYAGDMHPESFRPETTDALFGPEQQALFTGRAEVSRAGCAVKDLPNLKSREDFVRDECSGVGT